MPVETRQTYMVLVGVESDVSLEPGEHASSTQLRKGYARTMRRLVTVGFVLAFAVKGTGAVGQPFLPPAPAAPATRGAFLHQGADLAWFVREASGIALSRHLSPAIAALARRLKSEYTVRLASLNVTGTAGASEWNAKLDELKHLPDQYLDTRYPIEVRKALDQARRLCLHYSRRGADASTRAVAARWLREIGSDLPLVRKYGRSK